jgi:Predicted prefoldin, molecular chaperone implicated in de novo protein folding
VTQYGAEPLLKQLNELYSKYKFMEAQLQRSKGVLNAKLPDITNALEMVEYMQTTPEDLNVDFQLSDTIWTKAEIPKNNSVALWLGANVMMEYSHDEAKELLTTNLNNARNALKSTDEDLKFLKEQITTCEVNLSRVYNYSVISRQGK